MPKNEQENGRPEVEGAKEKRKKKEKEVKTNRKKILDSVD